MRFSHSLVTSKQWARERRVPQQEEEEKYLWSQRRTLEQVSALHSPKPGVALETLEKVIKDLDYF